MNEHAQDKLRLVIAGAQKSGTSSLSRWLFSSPHLLGHAALEFAFFLDDREYEHGFAWALSQYYKKREHGELLVAKSVGMMCDPVALNRLRGHNANCVLAVILRNPIDRAYSAYWFARRRGWEKAPTFEEALRHEPTGHAHDMSLRDEARQYVQKGHYIEYLRVMEKMFPRRQILVFLLEDFRNSPETLYRRIHETLGIVEPEIIAPLEKRSNAMARARWSWLMDLLNVRIPKFYILHLPIVARAGKAIKSKLRALNETSFQPPSMSEETRTCLSEKFAESNNELAEYLGRNLDHWT